MNTYQINNKVNGWITIPGDTEVIIAHYKDGHKEKMDPYQFISLSTRMKNQILKIDCYCKGEELKEDWK